MNTSGSFGQGICYDSGVTWEQLFWDTSGINRKLLYKEFTYIFELWTKYNKIVRSYDKPHVTLIGIRNHQCYRMSEVPYHSIIKYADLLNVKPVTHYWLRSVDEIMERLKNMEATDPTFEGFVLCDDSFHRIKIKTESYKQLHKLKGNGQFLYRNIIPQLLRNNFVELAKNFPEWLEELEETKEHLDILKINAENVLWETSEIRDRKEFAKYVQQVAMLPAIQFWIRDGKYDLVEQAFLQNEDYLIKYFEGRRSHE